MAFEINEVFKKRFVDDFTSPRLNLPRNFNQIDCNDCSLAYHVMLINVMNKWNFVLKKGALKELNKIAFIKPIKSTFFIEVFTHLFSFIVVTMVYKTRKGHKI